MHALLGALIFAASLTPTKTWFAPTQPITIAVKADGEASLVLTDFSGRVLDAKSEDVIRVTGETTVNLRDLYQQMETPGTYLLYVSKKPGSASDFLGTPLVIGVRDDRRRGAPPGPMVVKVEPLRFAVMQTEHGPITMAFYYDVAPHTSASFLDLSAQGFFDGLTFHRIVPGFVIQGGDPRGDGTGGPGYQIDAEFSPRRHMEGVLSMARSGDPAEAPKVMPRPEFANSAGSQFFICLDYANTRQLDEKYTVFGIVTGGMDAVRKIAQAPLADARAGKPEKPQLIQRVEVKEVVAGENPYKGVLRPQEIVVDEPLPASETAPGAPAN